MCGLGGAIGQGINVHIVRTLMVLNESRGRQSAGFFNSAGDTFKCGVNIKEFLKYKDCNKFLSESAKGTWALCGHTRQSTRGAINTANAHPFKYGTVTGSHNGCVSSAPVSYTVDSEYLIDRLAQAPPGDYQAALGDVGGWYALTWHDSRNGKVYFLTHRSPLCFNRVKGVVYYSSEESDLHVATGKKAEFVLQEGHVWSFDGSKAKQLDDFTAPAVQYPQWSGRDSSGSSYLDKWDKRGHPSNYMQGHQVLWDPPSNGEKFTGRSLCNTNGVIFGFYNDNKWRPLRDKNGSVLNVKWEQDLEEWGAQKAIALGEENLVKLLDEKKDEVAADDGTVIESEATAEEIAAMSDDEWIEYCNRENIEALIAEDEVITPSKLADEIREAELERKLDEDAAKWLPNTDDQVKWSKRVSQIGTIYTLGGIVGGTMLAGKKKNDQELFNVGKSSARALVDSIIINYGLKFATGRERPLENDGQGRFWKGSDGFPSGHAMDSFAVATVIARSPKTPMWLKITSYTVATAVSLSRLGVRRHFPSDIYAGAILGSLVGNYVATHQELGRASGP